MMRVVDYYKQLVYTYEQTEWCKLFMQTAIGEEVVAFEGNEEFFFSQPVLGHVGCLKWRTTKSTYVAVAKVSNTNTTYMVVSEDNNCYPFWDWDHGGPNRYIWNIPEMTQEELYRETHEDLYYED